MDREKAIVKTLEKQGWISQFMANEPRLSDAVEMYQETGFEVHLEHFLPQPRQPAEDRKTPT